MPRIEEKAGLAMENPEVAQILNEIADLLEIQGANPFRVRAYRNAERIIEDMGVRVADVLLDPKRKLEDLPGIGKDLAGKIRTIVETGDLPLRRELEKQVPVELRTLLAVPGLGPKRASILFKKLHVTSLDELRTAADAHRIARLKGFGDRSEQVILKSVLELTRTAHRILWFEAKVYAAALERHLRQDSGIKQLEVAGSFRRCKETVGDLDIVAASRRPSSIMNQLATFDAVETVLARGRTKMTIRLKTGLQVDLRVVPEPSFGAALLYFTGSKAHNIFLRRRAQEHGLKLNEYGLFRGRRCIAGRTEKDIYSALNLRYIPPELREDRGEIELAEKRSLSKLVSADEIQGDLHIHTTATDGRAELEEMVIAARQRGYAYLAITDHSRRVTMAHGLDYHQLRQQWKQIDALTRKHPGIAILKGVELDILEDGRMDLPDRVLQEADWVVASIHYGQNQSSSQITQRLLNAIRNRYVSAIGHLTGRLIGKRKPYQFDADAVFQAAANYGCLLEINAQPSRLDLDDVAILQAKELGVRFVVNTDAHSAEELRFMECGINQARRGRLEAADVVNTLNLRELRKAIRRK